MDNDPKNVLCHSHRFCHIADIFTPTFRKPTRFGWGGELSVVCRFVANCSSVSFPSWKKKIDITVNYIYTHELLSFVLIHLKLKKKLDLLKPLTTNKNSILFNFLVTSCTWHGGVIRKIVHVGCGLGYFGKPMSWGGRGSCLLSFRKSCWVE